MGVECVSENGYIRVTMKIREEWKFRDVVKEAADKSGESVNGFMIRAIRDAVRREGVDFPCPVLEEKRNGKD